MAGQYETYQLFLIWGTGLAIGIAGVFAFYVIYLRIKTPVDVTEKYIAECRVETFKKAIRYLDKKGIHAVHVKEWHNWNWDQDFILYDKQILTNYSAFYPFTNIKTRFWIEQERVRLLINTDSFLKLHFFISPGMHKDFTKAKIFIKHDVGNYRKEGVETLTKEYEDWILELIYSTGILN
jgi:hypothetical protein